MSSPKTESNEATELAGLCPAAEFPGTRSMAYLNSAGLGLIPRSVQAAADDFFHSVATLGTRAYFPRVREVYTRPRESAARLFNVSPTSIAIVGSVAEAMNQFAWAVRPAAGQNVVVVDIDHPSMTYPWLRVAEETGAEVRFVDAIDDPAAFSLEKIIERIDRRTAVVSVSHVLWTTGLCLDLKTLAKVAHEHGALLAVDATQSAGVLPIDAGDSGADIMATVGFKWLCAGAGAAACYVSPRIIDRIRPILAGGRSASAAENFRPAALEARRFDFPATAAKFEYGSSSHTARVNLAAAIDFVLAVGIARIQDHVRALGTQLIAGLRAIGAEILTPEDPSRRAGIVTARFGGWTGPALVEALEDRDVFTLPRLDGVRFSPHMFNDSADIDRALNALDTLLKRPP